ncbi:MAG: type I-E CRISPR-associated protein Cas5/CasD [bacterium]
MTPTLILRIEAPMQSWGMHSRFDNRDTALEPSKSGVIGLVCAALGRPRSQPIDDLAALAMAVRVDREGLHRSDYHTVGGGKVPGCAHYGVAKASGAKPGTVVSNRHYLTDAAFLVALAGDRDLLGHIHNAMLAPCWPLFFGRKSFVPGVPVLSGSPPWGGIHEAETPGQLLEQLPWIPRSPRDHQPDIGLRLVEEAADGAGTPRPDVPLSFEPGARRFSIRHVTTRFVFPPVWAEEEQSHA